MSRPVELNLGNLIPRYSGALPRELIDLASSLVAQSRNKCNIKPEEEVARVYACAHIACERLKTTLNLPLIEPRPPINPSAYKKLYTYFDKTLSITRSRSQKNTPSNTPKKPLPQRGTPSKEQSFRSFSTPATKSTTAKIAKSSARKRLQYGSRSENEDKVPRWIPHAIRLVCMEMETQRAIPHILAGVETVLTQPCPKAGVPEIMSPVAATDVDGDGNAGKKRGGKLPALVAAVWYLVVVKMRGVDGKKIEGVGRKNKVREVLEGGRENEWLIKRVGEEEKAWKGWEEVAMGDVTSWSREVVERGWLEGDWWENIEEGCGIEGGSGDVDEDLNMEDGVDEEIVVRRARKTDTMHLEKYDYLSAERRAEYKIWKEEILALVGEMRDVEDAEMVDA